MPRKEKEIEKHRSNVIEDILFKTVKRVPEIIKDVYYPFYANIEREGRVIYG